MAAADRLTGLEAVNDLRTLTRLAAERWGDKLALTFDETGERLTFREVERRAEAIGKVLRGLGVEAGDKVAVMLHNRPDFPLGWLAITGIGATMVPINVFYREGDAGYLLEDSGARLILTADQFVPLVTAIQSPELALETVVSVDGSGGGKARDLRRLLEDATDDLAPVEVVPEQLANIQYTSGTTGRPKGCMLSHYYWLELARSVVSASDIGGDDVVLTAQPFYYLDPQWNLLMTLVSGAHLVVLDRFHPSTFWHKIREHGVTFFYCLGVMPRLLLKMPPEDGDRDHRVRRVMCSAIPTGQHAELEERWGAPWYEAYGITEGGGGTVVRREDHDELVGSGCMGQPMPGREARVVGGDGRPVPRGLVGELVLRGPGLMDGYYKNPEATAEAFKDGWLHTGDLVRMDQCGRFYFVGREKDMVRRSGENISAAEVEETLEGHPGVKIAACVPVPDEVRGEEVKVYVVLQPGATAESTPPQALIEFCEQRLAYFKVPRYWSYRDDLPRTPSERVAKGTLRKEQEDLRTAAYDRLEDVWR
jgi:crotonobetaine/carnitine-CoA ligase